MSPNWLRKVNTIKLIMRTLAQVVATIANAEQRDKSSRVSMLRGNAAFFVQTLSETPITPLPLSLCKLQSHSAADIEIDIETVEKLIGEIIVQPLR